MKLLKSKKFELPILYFITDRSEIKDLPIGVPFIYGDESTEPYIIRLLEYEIIYQKALSTGLPFKFKNLLKEAGFDNLEEFWYYNTIKMDYVTKDLIELEEIEDSVIESFDKDSCLFKDFIRDSTAYVDIEKLKKLNVFPIWLENIENSISTNIHNFALYNPNMYNKKLDGMYGGMDIVSVGKNLIIIDISGSIPKAVSTTILTLGKFMAESFYADILITGSKSTLYEYENLWKLDIKNIYEENGMDNDQIFFKKLVSSTEKKYETAIIFGDNHSPSHSWKNAFNKRTKEISIEDGKKLCKWEINKMISFHTTSNNDTVGYGDWFSPKEIEKVTDWVKYLN